MNPNNINKQILFITIICIIFLLLIIFYHHIDKYLTGFIFYILFFLIPTTFILITVHTIKGLKLILREGNNLNFKYYLPTIITIITLLYALFSPFRLDSLNLESNVKMKACKEGTQNWNTIKFRDDHSFEIHHMGFGSHWNLGKWNKNGDTIFLKYDDKKAKFLGDTIILNEGYLIPISEIKLDFTKNFHRYYYLGDCKGEN